MVKFIFEEYLEAKKENPEVIHNHFSVINIKKLQFSLIDSFKLSYNGVIEPQIYQHLVELSNIQMNDDESKDVTVKVGLPPREFFSISIEFWNLSNTGFLTITIIM